MGFHPDTVGQHAPRLGTARSAIGGRARVWRRGPLGGDHASRRWCRPGSGSTQQRERLGVFLVYLAEQGYAEQVGTWISPSVPNVPLTGEQLLGAVPDGAFAGAAQAAGMSVGEYAEHLARELPALVDTVTPDGEPARGEEFEHQAQEFFSNDASTA
ncbi:YidB family protein [Streptomyces sp. NPDC059990]